MMKCSIHPFTQHVNCRGNLMKRHFGSITRRFQNNGIRFWHHLKLRSDHLTPRKRSASSLILFLACPHPHPPSTLSL